MQQAIHKSAAYETPVLREWNHDLFSCTDDCGFFLYACCFTPCAMCDVQTAHKKVNPKAADVAEVACFGNPVQQRSAIRRDLDIAGNLFTDCVEVQCCTPCALTQEYLELTRLPRPPPPPYEEPVAKV